MYRSRGAVFVFCALAAQTIGTTADEWGGHGDIKWSRDDSDFSNPSELDEVDGVHKETQGVCWDGTSFWVGGGIGQRVYQYDADWKYQESVDLSEQMNNGDGIGNVNDITWDKWNNHFYVQSQMGKIYRLDKDWKNAICFAGCCSKGWRDSSNAGAYGITNDKTHVYTQDASSLTYVWNKAERKNSGDCGVGKSVNSTPKCSNCRGVAFDGVYFYSWDYSGPNFMRQYFSPEDGEKFTGWQFQTFGSGDGLGMTFSEQHCALYLNDRARIWMFPGKGCATTTVTATTITTITTTITTTTITTTTIPTTVTTNTVTTTTNTVLQALNGRVSEVETLLENRILALTASFETRVKSLEDEIKVLKAEQTATKKATQDAARASAEAAAAAAPCATFETVTDVDGNAICTMKVDRVESLRTNN